MVAHPLTARVLGGVFCLGSAGLGALVERRWSSVRIPFQVAAVMLVLMLVAAVRGHAQFDPTRPLTWALLAGFTAVRVALAVTYRRMERARWDLVFADLYLDALDADLRGEPVSAPWRVAFDTARDQPDLQPLRHVLLGLNAHINVDLPQALVSVISSAEFADPDLLARRKADHLHLDTVLQSRVRDEDAELGAVSKVTVVDRLIRPANRLATRRLLAEARSKVWRNAVALDAARVRELTSPGPVLLHLARRGFGVLVPQPRVVAANVNDH